MLPLLLQSSNGALSTMLKSLTLLLMAKTALALPKFLVDSGRIKCISMEGPMDTVLDVWFEAPDLILDKTHENYGPAYISVNVVPSKRVLDFVNHPSNINDRLQPTSELLQSKKGKISHTMEVAGEARICIRASMASIRNPMLFGLLITRDDDKKGLGSSSDSSAPLENEEVESHLSHMELEMKRITTAMKRIISDADFSKEQDAMFHKQTASMHSATIFWPVVQVCVLLMTGFTQASHITNFFRQRRII